MPFSQPHSSRENHTLILMPSTGNGDFHFSHICAQYFIGTSFILFYGFLWSHEITYNNMYFYSLEILIVNSHLMKYWILKTKIKIQYWTTFGVGLCFYAQVILFLIVYSGNVNIFHYLKESKYYEPCTKLINSQPLRWDCLCELSRSDSGRLTYKVLFQTN